jgi:hypothetical protein
MKKKKQPRITRKILKGMSPLEIYLMRYLPACNNDIKVLKRWAGVLEKRAARFYAEKFLDDSVAEEDLYHEEDSSEKYPNLAYSEEHERKYKLEVLRDSLYVLREREKNERVIS